jgi:hypothetical protein
LDCTIRSSVCRRMASSRGSRLVSSCASIVERQYVRTVDPDTRAYIARRTAKGKTKKEIYSKHATSSTTTGPGCRA